MSWSFNTVKSIRFGKGLLGSIGKFQLQLQAARNTNARVLLITDPGLTEQTDIVSRALQYLKSEGIEVKLYNKVQADPPESIVLECTEIAKQFNTNSIIGLGGGSSLDVAKLVSVLADNRNNNIQLDQIYGVDNIQGSRLPLTLIPTTSGTGSEVTQVSIVTTGATTKMGCVSSVLLPDIALMDPELTYNLPPHITAATGIDAMVHAIEAYTSVNINNNPMSKELAIAALRKMIPAIEVAVHGGSIFNDFASSNDNWNENTEYHRYIQARNDMLLGSMWAGQAFANSPVAAVHALAYPIGGHFKVSHGLSNILVLPHVLRYNAETVPKPYAELATKVIFPNSSELVSESVTLSYNNDNDNDENIKKSIAVVAFKFIDNITTLSKRVGLEQSLSELNLGITKDKLPILAADAMLQSRLLMNNPRAMNENDILNIYKAAY
jgi:alcohol dehydrogenase class IV